MADQVTLARNNKLIVVHSSGPFNVIEVKLAITKIKYIHDKLGIDKVLVDRRNREELPTSEKYLEAGDYLAKHTQGKLMFAVLTSLNPELHNFFKSAMAIRGIVLEYFTEESEALRWLGF